MKGIRCIGFPWMSLKLLDSWSPNANQLVLNAYKGPETAVYFVSIILFSS